MEDSLLNSEISNKESLLRKCRDTIKILQEELDHSQRNLLEYDRQLKDSLSIQGSYQEELQEKTYQLHVVTQENKEIVAKYEDLLEKALKVQQDNENLNAELEIVKKRTWELEDSYEKTSYLAKDYKVELQSKSEIIKQWNGVIIELEDKSKLLLEENKLLKVEYEKEVNLRRELEKKLKITEDDKSLMFKSLQQIKEKLSSCRHELETKDKLLSTNSKILEETKTRSVSLEISLSEVAAKAKIYQEEVKSLKSKLETADRQTKDLTFKYNSDMERLNVTLENKSNFFNKEDSKKVSLITRLEHDLKFVKEELENLTSTDSMLQSRHRDLLDKYSEKKSKVKELEQENLRLNQSLQRFDEKLKSIESSYLSETKSLKQENLNLSEKIRKNEKSFSDKLENIQQEHIKKIDLLTQDNFRIKNELSKGCNELGTAIKNRDEEVLVLNEDRNKLQLALAELENKVIGLSRNLESSVSDCWRLSNELARNNENKKEEIEKIGDYYKLQLFRKNEEFNCQNEKYSERLKEKLSNFYEKASRLKESVKHDLDSLDYMIKPLSCKSELSQILSHIHSTLSNFII